MGRIFAFIWKTIVSGYDLHHKTSVKFEQKLKIGILSTWNRERPGYNFAKNCVFGIYAVQAASIRQYASMLMYEKWLKSMNKSKGEENSARKIVPRPEKLVKNENGVPLIENVDKFLTYLIDRQS
jgi:hypothetical protein